MFDVAYYDIILYRSLNFTLILSEHFNLLFSDKILVSFKTIHFERVVKMVLGQRKLVCLFSRLNRIRADMTQFEIQKKGFLDHPNIYIKLKTK